MKIKLLLITLACLFFIPSNATTGILKKGGVPFTLQISKELSNKGNSIIALQFTALSDSPDVTLQFIIPANSKDNIISGSPSWNGSVAAKEIKTIQVVVNGINDMDIQGTAMVNFNDKTRFSKVVQLKKPLTKPQTSQHNFEFSADNEPIIEHTP